MNELFSILTLTAGYNAALVCIGCALLGAASGLVGTFTLLRKRALVSDALAHATLPGVCGAFLLAGYLKSVGILPASVSARSLLVLLPGASVSCVLSVLCLQWLRSLSGKRIGPDASIGIVLSVFFGAGYVLLSWIQSAETENPAGLKSFIFGQPAAMSRQDALLLTYTTLFCILSIGLLFKELRLLSFDEQLARVQGWPVRFLEMVLMGLVVLVCVVGLQAVGLILVVALMIIPPTAARMYSDRLSSVLLIAGGLGFFAGYIGAGISALAPGLPAGAIIVLLASGLFFVSAMLAPRRGFIPRVYRHIRLQRKIRHDHALRYIYEAAQSQRAARIDSPRLQHMRRTLIGLQHEGLVSITSGTVTLTSQGEQEAYQTLRNHRLWEQYLIVHARVDPSHVDRSADMIEHVLSPELVEELEGLLEAQGRLPESPHEIVA